MFEHWAAKTEWDALEYSVSYGINAKSFNISTLLFILILLFTLVFLATTAWNRGAYKWDAFTLLDSGISPQPLTDRKFNAVCSA
jgi:hypothetical protein